MNAKYPDLDNNFPISIDNFDKIIDPDLKSLPAINQYYKKFDSGDIQGAKKVLTDNPQLKNMILDANNLNKLRDGLISVERLFFDEVQQYLVDIIKPKGDWVSTSKYTKYDVVQYVHAGAIESYMGAVTTIPIGALPTDSTYFTPITLRGQQGASGIGLSYRMGWDGITQYYANDCVTYNNILWSCSRDNLNSIPQETSVVWSVVLRLPGTTWATIADKPTTFQPSAHTHTNADLPAYPTTLPANGGTANAVPWAGVTGKPALYTQGEVDTKLAQKADWNDGFLQNGSIFAWAESKKINTCIATSTVVIDTPYAGNWCVSVQIYPPGAWRVINALDILNNNRFYSTKNHNEPWTGWNKKTITATYTATIGTAASQNIGVNGIVATDNPTVDVILSGDKATDTARIEAWSAVSRITTYNGGITVMCYNEAPKVVVPIQIKVVR